MTMVFGCVGLDLSLTSTGIAHRDGSTSRLRFPKLKGAARLAAIRDGVNDATWNATLVVIEGYAFGATNKLAEIGELGGVVRVALHEAGRRFVSVPPAMVKKFATGKGNAAKEEMVAAAATHLGYKGKSNDEADALWLRAMGLASQYPARWPADRLALLSTLNELMQVPEGPGLW